MLCEYTITLVMDEHDANYKVLGGDLEHAVDSVLAAEGLPKEAIKEIKVNIIKLKK